MKPSRWLFLTCGTTFALLVGMALLAVHIIEAPSFPSLTPYLLGQGIDSPFHRRGESCEILVYGDSAAMTGYDPRRLSRQTGLSACNISQPIAIVEQMGTVPLDSFIEHNRAPKFLVFQLSPEALYHDPNWDHLIELSQIAVMLRQRPGPRTDFTLLRHAPNTATYFSSILRQRLFPEKGKLSAFYQQYRDAIDLLASIGYTTFPTPPETGCNDAFAKALPASPDRQWIDGLRSQYRAKGMTVLVNVSPIKACAPRMDFFRKTMADLPDNRLVGYPNRMFNDNGRHFTAEGAKLATDALADQINAIRQAQSKPANEEAAK